MERATGIAGLRFRLQGATNWRKNECFKQKQMIFCTQQILTYLTNDKDIQ